MTLRKIVAPIVLGAFAFGLLVSDASAQNPWSTAAMQAWKQSITASGRMGVPRIPTASLPTCDASTLGMVVMDTTTSTFKACDGTTFDEMGTFNGGTVSGATTFAQAVIFQNVITLGANAGNNGGFIRATAQTPDTDAFLTGTDGNSFIFIERADLSTDFAHAQQSNPTLFVQSADATQVTQFAALSFRGVEPNRTTVTVDGATTFAVTSGYINLQCTGAETINTITGAVTGTVLYLENTDTDCTIADDDAATASNAVNLVGAGTNDVGAAEKVIVLLYNGSSWYQIAESDN